MSIRLYLIIPVFNEEGNVGNLVESLRVAQCELLPEVDLQVVFVDDGSRDTTVSRIRAAGGGIDVTVLEHGTNKGPGAAFATGFAHCAAFLESQDWIVTMEGDNTSSLDTLKHMLIRRKEGYDVVLASPYLYGGGLANVKAHRAFLSFAANEMVKAMLGIRGIQSFSCFFRLHSAPIIGRLQDIYGPAIIESAGFECMVEMLAKLVRVGARISEVEMVMDWTKRRGASKMNVMKTIRGYFRLFALRKRILRGRGKAELL
jgi:dolichol-phosphate mannosyltransferase